MLPTNYDRFRPFAPLKKALKKSNAELSVCVGNFYPMGGRSMDGVGNDFTHPFEYDPVANGWTINSATYPDNHVSNMACGVLTDSGTPYIYCVGGSAGGQAMASDRCRLFLM